MIRCYGYDYNNKTKKLSINTEQTKVIKEIVDMYMSGMGTCKIARMLTENKVKTPSGKNNIWNEGVITKILKNEKICGDLYLEKWFKSDPFEKRVIENVGQKNKYIVKNHHEGIISREKYNELQAEINKRAEKQKSLNYNIHNEYTLSGVFRCGFCGRVYVKKSLYKKRAAWDCISVVKYTREICKNSRLMHEDVVKSSFMEAFKLLTSNEGVEIDKFVNNIKDIMSDNTPDKMIKRIETEMSADRRKLSKVVDLFVEEKIDQHTFELKQKKIQKLIDDKEEKIKIIKKENNINDRISTEIEQIKKDVLNFAKDTSTNKLFDEELFNTLLDYGILGAVNELGQHDPYVIRFIIKNNFNKGSKDDITEEKIVDNNRLDKEDSIYMPILDFISNQHFFAFDRTENGLRKKLITKVRVRVEVER